MITLHRGVAVVRVALLDGVAELAQARGGALDGAALLVVDLRGEAARDLERVRDPQLPRRARARPPANASPFVAASRKQAASRTPRVSAPVTDIPCQSLRHRHAVALRLEAEQAAARGGDADRAGAVGAERRRGEPGGDRRARAAARAAGDPLRGPTGCAWRRTRATRSSRSASSSGTCVLPRSTAPAARSRATTSASRCRRAAVRERAARGDLAGDVRVVLDRDRDAVERRRVRPAAAVGLRRPRRAPRSASTTRYAWSCGSRRAIRSR